MVYRNVGMLQGQVEKRRPPTMSPRCMSRPGFSLLELILVLGIVIVMGAIAVPRFASADARYRADFAAQRVASDLALAQRAARSSGTATTIAFDADQERYQTSTVTALDGTGNYVVEIGQSPYLADLTLIDFDSTSVLNFDAWGVPDANGTVKLTVGTEKRTISITAPSGEVTIQ